MTTGRISSPDYRIPEATRPTSVSRLHARRPRCDLAVDEHSLCAGSNSPIVQWALFFPITAAFDHVGCINRKRTCKSAQHSHAHRCLPALDLPHVANAQSHPTGEFFLRPAANLTQPSQIDRHQVLEIAHGESEALWAVPHEERPFLFVAKADRLAG